MSLLRCTKNLNSFIAPNFWGTCKKEKKRTWVAKKNPHKQKINTYSVFKKASSPFGSSKNAVKSFLSSPVNATPRISKVLFEMTSPWITLTSSKKHVPYRENFPNILYLAILLFIFSIIQWNYLFDFWEAFWFVLHNSLTKKEFVLLGEKRLRKYQK